tara:strand:- start:19 stop:249 length:231 start_codon:yes stop_codon:yes gene_type:complete
MTDQKSNVIKIDNKDYNIEKDLSNEQKYYLNQLDDLEKKIKINQKEIEKLALERDQIICAKEHFNLKLKNSLSEAS